MDLSILKIIFQECVSPNLRSQISFCLFASSRFILLIAPIFQFLLFIPCIDRFKSEFDQGIASCFLGFVNWITKLLKSFFLSFERCFKVIFICMGRVFPCCIKSYRYDSSRDLNFGNHLPVNNDLRSINFRSESKQWNKKQVYSSRNNIPTYQKYSNSYDDFNGGTNEEEASRIQMMIPIFFGALQNKNNVPNVSLLLTFGLGLSYLLELIGYGFIKRIGPLGIWISTLLTIYFLVLTFIVILSHYKQWKHEKNLRKKGFLDYFDDIIPRWASQQEIKHTKKSSKRNYNRSSINKEAGPSFVTTSIEDLNESMETLPTTFLAKNRSSQELYESYSGAKQRWYEKISPFKNWKKSRSYRKNPSLTNVPWRNSEENEPFYRSHPSREDLSRRIKKVKNPERRKVSRPSSQIIRHASGIIFSAEDLIDSDTIQSLKQSNNQESINKNDRNSKSLSTDVFQNTKPSTSYQNQSFTETSFTATEADENSKKLFGIIPLQWTKRKSTLDLDHSSINDEYSENITDYSNQSFIISQRSPDVSQSVGSVYTVRSPIAYNIHRYQSKENKKKRGRSKITLGLDSTMDDSSLHSSNFSDSASEVEMGYDTPSEDIEMESSHKFSGEDTPSPKRKHVYATPLSQFRASTPSSPFISPKKKKSVRRSLYDNEDVSRSNSTPNQQKNQSQNFYSFGILPLCLIFIAALINLLSASSNLDTNFNTINTISKHNNADTSMTNSISNYLRTMDSKYSIASIFQFDSDLPFNDGRCSYPLSWPPQSPFEISSYIIICLSVLLSIGARIGQIVHLNRSKSSHRLSRLMFFIFIVSNLLHIVSVVCSLIETRDYLSQLPYAIGPSIQFFLDAYILLISFVFIQQKEYLAVEVDEEDEEEI